MGQQEERRDIEHDDDGENNIEETKENDNFEMQGPLAPKNPLEQKEPTVVDSQDKIAPPPEPIEEVEKEPSQKSPSTKDAVASPQKSQPVAEAVE